MKKYKVTICHSYHTTTEIEAESDEAAYSEAQDMKWNTPGIEDMGSAEPHVYDVTEIEKTFVAPDNPLVTADYSKLEARVLAAGIKKDV